jgi:hypothetical protein
MADRKDRHPIGKSRVTSAEGLLGWPPPNCWFRCLLFNDLRGRLRDPFLTSHEKRLSAVMRSEPAKHSLIDLPLIGIHRAAMCSQRYPSADG